MKKLNFKGQMSSYTKSSIISYGMIIIGFILITILNSMGLISSSLQGQLVPICAYIIMSISLNLVVGISGELSLGHAGFMAVGAYTGIIISQCLISGGTSEIIRFVLAIIGGGVAAGILGFFIGIPVLKLRGDYLAIVTLAFGEIIRNVMNIVYVGKDVNGLHITTNSTKFVLDPASQLIILNGPMGATGTQKLSTFTAGVILILITLFIAQNLINSKHGRAIMAIRDNRIAGESIGLSVMRYKMTAFVISAVLAGIGGVLFGLNYSTLAPLKFRIDTSILILLFVVLGGIGNIWGGMIAATVLTVLPEMLRQFADYRMLAYAIVLIIVMICTYNPKIKSHISALFEKIKKNKKVNSVEGGDVNE